MGEVAEMIQDGILCEFCGVYIGDEVGHPRKCSRCLKDEKRERRTSDDRKVSRARPRHTQP